MKRYHKRQDDLQGNHLVAAADQPSDSQALSLDGVTPTATATANDA